MSQVVRKVPQQLQQLGSVKRRASFYDRRFIERGHQPLARISLQTLVAFDKRYEGSAKLLVSANEVRNQLPIRLARRILDMNFLPYITVINPHLQHVYETYIDAFDKLTAFPAIRTLEEEAQFCQLLRDVLESSRTVLPRLARASKEISSYVESPRLNTFIDDFIVSRISRRVLAEQHLALHEQHFNPEKYHPDDVGTITMHCDPLAACHRAFDVAASTCRATYGVIPRLEVVGPTPNPFPYISRHVEYIMLEIFKNAVRATVEHYMQQHPGKMVEEHDLPPITISIYSGKNESHIRVSDKGGGIPNSLIARVWDYAFTTVGKEDTSVQDMANHNVLDLSARTMAGEGFGLPMARNYARYFGGDVSLQSMEGHGTEVYVRLAHLDRQQYVITDKEALSS